MSPKLPPLRTIILAVGVVVAVAVVGYLVIPKHSTDTTVTPNPSPSTSSSVYPAPKASASPSASPANWSTSSYQKSFKGEVPPTPQLTEVRTAGHADEGFDRIAFDFFQTNVPGYRIQYVAQATKDGSGAPVSLGTPYILQVVFDPAAAHTDSGQPSLPSPPTDIVAANLGALQSYTMTGDFEGRVSFALGLATKNGYRVEEVHRGANLWTVYIDIKR